MFDEATSLEINEGKEIIPRSRPVRLRSEVLDRLQPDTIVIVDSHWFSTVEHLISAHARRQGIFTSSELHGDGADPLRLPRRPRAGQLWPPISASNWEHPPTPQKTTYLPVYYATINLVHYLRKDEKVVSVSLVQTGDTDDFMTMGEAIGEAVSRLDRRVVVLASGGMSHTFWPLKEYAKHEASDPVHIITPAAAGRRRGALGDDAWPATTPGLWTRWMTISSTPPEGNFGHYLMMLGADWRPELHAPRRDVLRLRERHRHRTGSCLVRPAFGRLDRLIVSALP